MSKLSFFTIICLTLFLVFVYGCNKGSTEKETAEASAHDHEHGEQAEHSHEHGEQAKHDDEHGEHEGEGEGEEAGPQIPLDGAYDEVRKGVRLILSFDNESSSFMGTLENVTSEAISRVRVEVHLSNGTELGPTKLMDLEPGQKVEVKLPTEGQSFTWWKAHAESGASEHRD
ncbi:FxLYD domain-containing protein [Acidobacteriota bacterium]